MKTYRWIVFGILIALIPIGLVSKFYQGPLQFWVNNSFSSIFYELFWIFLVVFIQPRLSPGWVAFWVFIVTAVLEFMQLWKPPFLQAIRATLMGRLLLGTTFVWGDFLYYVLGCVVGWLILRGLRSKYVKS
ncbi:MAG: DUF2809 domain-containing protein [Limnoraphis robusta]|uniref:DUF2809 domain-containing protein n=1 Tax=Limnoraphis robusta CS-951 TaxID=1637645 RepID=A0A0F5YH81_9CYAN|nr:DUF2809 domain-containing protein [Limnoraphis robusta]KKD38246.1 hypothetical protein WN50_09970 [Limnoraphis robusta CS-951]